MPYVTESGGGAIICDAEGRVVARRSKDEGAGVVVADVAVKRVNPIAAVPAGFWIQELGPLSKSGWRVRDWHGRSWHRRHVTEKGKAK